MALVVMLPEAYTCLSFWLEVSLQIIIQQSLKACNLLGGLDAVLGCVVLESSQLRLGLKPGRVIGHLCKLVVTLHADEVALLLLSISEFLGGLLPASS